MIGMCLYCVASMLMLLIIDSSIDFVKERVTTILAPLASQYNLSLTSFGEDLSSGAPAYGSLILSDAWGTALTPAPVSPSGTDSAPYTLLSASIKASIVDSGITDKKVSGLVRVLKS